MLIWGLVGVAVVVVGVLVYYANSRARGPVELPVVYSGPVYETNGHELACTSQVADRLERWVCTGWVILQPAQVARSAVDPGTPCGARHADQVTGRWVCDRAVVPSAPVPLPPPVDPPTPGPVA